MKITTTTIEVSEKEIDTATKLMKFISAFVNIANEKGKAKDERSNG